MKFEPCNLAAIEKGQSFHTICFTPVAASTEDRPAAITQCRELKELPHLDGSYSGLHCDTGTQSRVPVPSVLMNVIEPFTLTLLLPIKLIFPPEENVETPPSGKKVTISPGPNVLCIVLIGVVDA